MLIYVSHFNFNKDKTFVAQVYKLVKSIIFMNVHKDNSIKKNTMNYPILPLFGLLKRIQNTLLAFFKIKMYYV